MRIAGNRMVNRDLIIESLENRRLLSAGQLDPTFSGDGRLADTLPNNAVVNGGAVQSDGKILVVGTMDSLSGSTLFVARYTANGVLDTSFSGDGLSTLSFTSANNEGGDIAVDSLGRIIVAGNSASDWAIARFLSNGNLDTSFSGDGKVAFAKDGMVKAVAIQSDNKIVIGGGGLELARLTTAGALDPTFSGDGKVSGLGNFNGVEDVAIAPNGKIVVGGRGNFTAAPDAALARFNSDGTPDSTFTNDPDMASTGGPGWATFEYNSTDKDGNVTQYDDNLVLGVAVQSDNRIVVTGSTSDGDYAAAQFAPSGELLKTLDAGRQPAFYAFGESVAIGPNDQILVGADTYTSDRGADFLLYRYNADGTRDTRFGVDGMVETDFGGQERVVQVAIANGKAVAIGGGRLTFQDETPVQPRIARYDNGNAQYLPPVSTLPDGSFQIVGTDNAENIDLYRYDNDRRQLVAASIDGAVFTVPNQSTAIKLNAFGGNDHISVDTLLSENSLKIDAGAGNDVVTIAQDNATIWGGDGNDYVAPSDTAFSFTAFGGIGQDTIYGGDGVDALYGEGGNDFLYGGAEADRLEGGGGNDSVYGMGGNDYVIGSSGDDRVEGGAGDDRMEGQSGDDSLYGNAGRDGLFGGSGNDLLDGGSSPDFMQGNDGEDTVTYAARANGVLVSLNNVADDGEGSEGDNVNSDIEDVVGTNKNDLLKGSDSPNRFYALAGDDIVTLEGNNDYAEGGAGNDTILGLSGNDTLYGNGGNDRVDGGTQNDRVDGGAGIDSLIGGDGTDTIFARDNQVDQVFGGNGTDAAQVDNSASVKDEVLGIESFI